jgi:sugar O-acyltransferase (sialic acid O-acetyltransferase NeuD family)
VILQGGGEHARVVLDCLQAQGANVLALFDPKYTGELFGVPQRGVYDPAFAPDARAVVAIGSNAVRRKVVGITQHAFTNAIHPSAIVSPYATAGTGNMILHGSVIQAQARIGDHVIVNTGAQVDHDCVVGDYVHLAPGVVVCGTVTIGEGTFVGAGATIIPGRKIGAWATIGAGAVVIRDVPDHAVVVGNPARVVRYNQP